MAKKKRNTMKIMLTTATVKQRLEWNEGRVKLLEGKILKAQMAIHLGVEELRMIQEERERAKPFPSLVSRVDKLIDGHIKTTLQEMEKLNHEVSADYYLAATGTIGKGL